MTAPDVPTGGRTKRFTVSFTDRGVSALANVRQLRQETQNTAVQNAVILYNDVMQILADGGNVLIERPGEDGPRRVHLLL